MAKTPLNVTDKPVDHSKRLQSLAAAMGSKEGTDPIPPSQYLYFLDRQQPALQRLVAWVRAKTIRHRPGRKNTDGRSAFCVDDSGKPLGLADLARELSWQLPFASKEWKLASGLGLVRKEGKRLYLAGDVPAPTMANGKRNVICTDNVSPYLRRTIEKWPEARQREFFEVWEPAIALSMNLQARKIAEARDLSTKLQDSILSHFGLQAKRVPKRTQGETLELPEKLRPFVQIDPSGSVQITFDLVRTDNKTGVRTDNSILMQQRNTQRVTPESSSSLVVSEVAALLLIDDVAAVIICHDCAAINPEVTALELLVLAEWKLRQVGKRVTNPTGLLMKALPKMVTGNMWEAAKIEAQRRAKQQAFDEAEEKRLSDELSSLDHSENLPN